ncbi:UNKNOWN [Stylonychia lemnae]|uniref:Uncharacterized protein n=1 Tax=Stylonychia lemnae TaxID=5949 RepID=A0A078AAU8_STYLE|nr:UNKNOWN [Stylonychia lemnae]|eukprot:CDW78976.1 UNKNOWN [Stylonychia lemnae]
MDLAIITDPSYTNIQFKQTKERRFPSQTVLTRKRVISRNQKLDPLYTTQTGENRQEGTQSNQWAKPNMTLQGSPVNFSENKLKQSLILNQEKQNHRIKTQHNRINNRFFISQKQAKVDGSSQNNSKSPCKKINLDISHVNAYQQMKNEKQMKRQLIQASLNEAKKNIPAISQKIMEHSPTPKYRNHKEFVEMMAQYPNLSLYEKLHLDGSGLHPLSRVDEEPSRLNISKSHSSLTKTLRERYQFELLIKASQNKKDKDLPKQIMDDSSMYQSQKDFMNANKNLLKSKFSHSYKDRLTKFRKLIFNIKNQLKLHEKPETESNENESVIHHQYLLNSDQEKLIRGFLQKYMTSEEMRSVHSSHIQQFMDIISSDSDELIQKELESKSFQDLFQFLLFGTNFGNNLANMSQLYQNSVDQSQMSIGESFIQSQSKQNYQSNTQVSFLAKQQLHQQHIPGLIGQNTNRYRNLAKNQSMKTFQDCVDQFKKEFVSDYETWQSKLDQNEKMTKIYQKINQQSNYSEQEHKRVLQEYIKNNKKILGTEIVMPSVERDAAQQNVSTNSINFGYAGMNITKYNRESPNKKKLGTVKEEEENIGVLRRNKLLLEHVVINRHKSLSTLVEEQGYVPKKLTTNIGNSAKKNVIDVDIMELEKYIKNKSSFTDNQLKLNYNK